MFEKILIAIGNYPESQVVLSSGLTLAEKLGGKVLLLHVMNSSLPNGFSPLVGGMFPIINEAAIDQYIKELKEYEKIETERLQECARQANERGIEAEIFQNIGDAGRIICEVAQNWSADAIVMGRNQKSMFSEVFLGSTSNYVLHHAPCSVMVVQLPVLSS